MFKEKLKRVPLENYFPEYNGDTDYVVASKFLLYLFLKENKAGLSIYPHLTCATDTKGIKVVFGSVKDTIIKRGLIDSGIL